MTPSVYFTRAGAAPGGGGPMHSTPCSLGSTLTLLALARADDMDGGLAPKSNLAVGMRKAQEAERALFEPLSLPVI